MQAKIKTEKGEWLLVAVPKDANIMQILNKSLIYIPHKFSSAVIFVDLDPLRNYTLLGIYPNLTEEQAAMVSDTPFASLMEANELYTVNPYGNEPLKYTPDEGSSYESFHSKWQQAQSRTSECWAVIKIEK